MKRFDIYEFDSQTLHFVIRYRNLSKKECKKLRKTHLGLFLAVRSNRPLTPFSDSACVSFCIPQQAPRHAAHK